MAERGRKGKKSPARARLSLAVRLYENKSIYPFWPASCKNEKRERRDERKEEKKKKKEWKTLWLKEPIRTVRYRGVASIRKVHRSKGLR